MKGTATTARTTSDPGSKPTPESIMAEILASADPRGLARRVLAAIDELDQPMAKPLSAAAVWGMPIETLLERVGLDTVEIDRSELPSSVQSTFTGMLVQPIKGRPLLVLPRNQDTDERSQSIRRFAWRQITDPVASGSPAYLPGSKPVCHVSGCQNEHMPDPDSDFEITHHHFGSEHTARGTDGSPIIGAWFEIDASHAYIKVETFDCRPELNVTDGRAFAKQLRDLADAIDRDLDTIEATP